MSRSHHRSQLSDDGLGSVDYSGGSDRILDLVNQKDVEKSENKGTVSINQMARVFRMFQPDEDNTIAAENVTSFLRSKLGYRPDRAVVAALFSDLNHKVTGADDVAQASASSNTALRRAAVAAVEATDEKEMHLNTFIQVLRQATAPRTTYSDHSNGQLDPELDELLRSLDLMAISSERVSEDGSQAAPGLLSVATLKHRMRVCRGDKLTESEMSSLIEFAGVYERDGRPMPPATGHEDEGFIQFKNFVYKLALNKPAAENL